MRTAFLALVLCASVAQLALAAPPSFTYPLFNGRDLSGWHVTRCETVVENGAILLKAGNGFVRTDHRYRDFVLELDWKALKNEAWDSGIYFRSAELPGPTGRAWPNQYQVNLAQGLEGNIKGLPGAESQGLVKPGEWNHFKLTAVGKTAELEINGKPAWRTEALKALDGYIGLQCEEPVGGQFEFRDIRITELGYQSLLGDKDLRGAEGYGWEGATADASSCWKLVDGVLECTGERGPWLRSLREYGDFNLRLEYKLKPGGNSGVYLRVPHKGDHRGRELADGPSGVEVQLLDDAAERYADIKPEQFAGSIYAVAPANPHVSRPAGEWNTLEIDCRGTKYRVVHNGVTVIDVDAEKFPELVTREMRGYLGLQDHREPVWFRNIRIAPE